MKFAPSRGEIRAARAARGLVKHWSPATHDGRYVITNNGNKVRVTLYVHSSLSKDEAIADVRRQIDERST